jgi:hypothetical protein
MKLALIGADEESLDFVEDELFHGSHQLIAAFDSAAFAAQLRDMAQQVVLDEDWESLLLGTRADLVIVGRGLAQLTDTTGIPDSERRGEQLRKLAQAAVPLLVFVPSCESIVGFEIEMIRRDTGGHIKPYIPAQGNLTRMLKLVRDGEESAIGRIEQLTFDREMEPRFRPNVLTQFARDVALIRQFIGRIAKITASGPPSPPGRDPLGPKLQTLPSLSNLSVHLQGESDFSARWSIGPVASERGARLTLIGSAGRAIIHMPEPARQWMFEIIGKESEQWSEWVEHPETSLLPAEPSQLSNQYHDPDAWLNACRDQEVAEAVDRSLARGRTIELFGEEHTEEDSFKGVMAVGGCLLLVMALGVVFIATIVEGLRLPMRDWMIWQYWPIYLLVPVVVFLLLQLLQLALKRDESSLRQLIEGNGPGN